MTRLGALVGLALRLAACAASEPAAAPTAPPVEPVAASGPVIGPAMTPAPAVSGAPAPPAGELLAPAVFPPAKPADLDLSAWLPTHLGKPLIAEDDRARFADAERAFVARDFAVADKGYAAMPSSPLLAPYVMLARLRLRAAREGWPTQVGSGSGDARIATAIAKLRAVELPRYEKPCSRAACAPGTPTSPQCPRCGAGPLSLPRDPFDFEEGRWLLVRGDYAQALAKLEEVAKSHGDTAEVLSLLGLARLASGQVAAALEPLERATALDVGSAARWGNLGTIRMMNGKINEAARAYEARVRLAPDDAQGHADLGIALVQVGELTRGRTELQKATELEPERASYLSNYAYALHRSGKRAESRAAYERALGKDAKSIVALLGLSALLSENPAELPEARRVFVRAETIAPDDPRVLAAKADLLELEQRAHGH